MRALGTTLFAIPLACATAANPIEPAGSGQGGATNTGGEGGTAEMDAGTDAPSVACTGASDCEALSDPCNVGACINGMCEKQPANDFGACNDNLFCTENDTCQNGQCVGGTAKFCPAIDSCHIGICNEQSDQCQSIPGNDGAQCDSGDPCTTVGSCSNGVCLSGDPLDCSFLDGLCAQGVCDPQQGNCVQQLAPDGSPCNDTLFCTINDICLSGLCTGQPNSCPAPANVCLIGTCDEAANACSTAPGPNGVACDDSNVCTANEVCMNGTCSGGAAVNQGGSCNDGNDCTANDACNGGICQGTSIVQCGNGDGCCPAGCSLVQDDDCVALSSPSYDASQTFQDALPTTTMTLCWDGTYFWSSSGGSQSGLRLARYSATGVLLQTYQPGIDFRSIFTKGDGTIPVFARAYNATQIRVQTAPGIFGNDVVLMGGTPDLQGAVVYDSDSLQLVSLVGGTVRRWASNGSFVSDSSLSGFGSMNNENQYPQDRGLVYQSGWYLTYSNGVLSGWDMLGQRLKTTILNGAGTSFDSYFSLSYAAGKVWIVDAAGGTWRGYDVGL